MTARRWSRTTVAALLIAAGVTVPCAAWYVAGSRAAREQAARLAAVPREQGRLEAAHLAQQVALRLESLRESESRRPFQEYLGDAAIPLEGCTIEPPLRSPLAQGPADPLVWAHFQIDDVGLLTLPTLTGAARANADSVQQAIFNELECASSDHLAALRRPSDPAERRRWSSPQGAITVGPFSWHTSSIEGSPALVALREVWTPALVLTQGFVVPAYRLESLLAGSPYPASIAPGAPDEDGDALVPLQGDAWSVRIDASRSIAAAEAEAARIEARFRRTFLLGAIAAALAGCAVVLLVHQGERVAVARARFAAAAAHELRTPLAGLQLYGEMLADDSGDPARHRVYARRVADEAQRLGRVVANVVGFSRLQRGGLQVVLRDGELEPAVRDALDRLRPALESRGAQVELEVEGSLPAARFDGEALHQILQNLLDNAEKFSRGSADRTLRVALRTERGRPTVSVRDRGRGVEPRRRRLFRAPTRTAPADASAGLGIGLVLVGALAEAQGATVGHRRPPGGGAEFFVRFRPAGLRPEDAG